MENKEEMTVTGTVAIDESAREVVKDLVERTEEQELFLQSFKMALPLMERVLTGAYGRPFMRFREKMKRTGNWTHEMIAKHFVLCAGKLSTLSHIEREYILAIGAKAREIYDTKLNPENKDE